MRKSLALVLLLTAAACVQRTFKGDNDDDDDGSIFENDDDDGEGGSGNGSGSTKATSTTKATSATSAGATTNQATTVTSTSGPTTVTSTTVTSTTGGNTCDDEMDCNACQTCAFGSECANEAQACTNNPECIALNDCLNLCAEPACSEQCVLDHQAGENDLNNLALCAFCDACYVSCDGANLGC